MYKIIDGKETEYKLSPVTAKTEKALADLGLIKTDPTGSDRKLNELLDEPNEETIKLCNVLFRGEPVKSEDIENLDKTEIRRGALDFFLADVMLIRKYFDSNQNLDLLTTMMMQQKPS